MNYNTLLAGINNRAVVRRIYLQTDLSTGQTVALTPEAYHYAVRVLRCRDGEKLCVFNGDGNDYHVTLSLESKKSACVSVDAVHKNHNESPLHTILIQGLSKGERMDMVMQKAVELGANEIYPVRTEFCAVKLDGERLQKKMQHWQSVMISACEQSERAVLPTLHPLQNVNEVIAKIQADEMWVLHPYETDQKCTNYDDRTTRVALLIGPEGGLSDEEVKLSITNGFTPKVLGRRILRTETAAISALSLVQQYWGDFDVEA